jgi:hypothetical protein
MQETIKAITENPLAISLAALGVLIFVMILKSLRGTSFFRGRIAIIIAACATIISIMGMYKLLIAPEKPLPCYPYENANKDETGGISIYLVPYTALGIAILLLVLLLLVHHVAKWIKRQGLCKPTERTTAQPTTDPMRTESEQRFKSWSKPKTNINTDRCLNRSIENGRQDRRR